MLSCSILFYFIFQIDLRFQSSTVMTLQETAETYLAHCSKTPTWPLSKLRTCSKQWTIYLGVCCSWYIHYHPWYRQPPSQSWCRTGSIPQRKPVGIPWGEEDQRNDEEALGIHLILNSTHRHQRGRKVFVSYVAVNNRLCRSRSWRGRGRGKTAAKIDEVNEEEKEEKTKKIKEFKTSEEEFNKTRPIWYHSRRVRRVLQELDQQLGRASCCQVLLRWGLTLMAILFIPKRFVFAKLFQDLFRIHFLFIVLLSISSSPRAQHQTLCPPCIHYGRLWGSHSRVPQLRQGHYRLDFLSTSSVRLIFFIFPRKSIVAIPNQICF